jgi:oligosaccharyltransferase complex subunit delta (ribophorin II)
VKVLKATDSSAKSASIMNSQDLIYDASSGLHILDTLSNSADVGVYNFVFVITLHEPDQNSLYATGETQNLIYITGAIKVESSEITVLSNDLDSLEAHKVLDIASKNSVSLSANHLQKLRVSFQLSTPLGNSFKPHQAILKLRHESKLEHLYMVKNSGKQFEIVLDFLGLVEKLFYLSGTYDIELSVGDAVMENSFLWSLGHIDLELPGAPEKATRPPPTPLDPHSRYGPKAEISHIFRSPEKRPSENLSYAFLGLVLLPLVGFLVGLLRLGINLKNFPSSGLPAIFAILFHVGIAAVLGLYALFWLKLNLFVTLKFLGFLAVFLVFVGHRVLSHLASTSVKLKSV